MANHQIVQKKGKGLLILSKIKRKKEEKNNPSNILFILSMTKISSADMFYAQKGQT